MDDPLYLRAEDAIREGRLALQRLLASRSRLAATVLENRRLRQEAEHCWDRPPAGGPPLYRPPG